MVPGADPGHSRDDWVNAGAALMEAARSGQMPEPLRHYAAMNDAFRAGNAGQFNQAVTGLHQWLLAHDYAPEVAKGRNEHFFNRVQAFYKCMVLYVAAFLCACISWFNRNETLRRSGVALILVALVVHTGGLIFRMALEGRPPVTNLYSSAIFIGWGAAVFGLGLERCYRDGIGTVVAGLTGFSTLVIAHNLSMSGDTMEMLRAVLDTNFWLATHVVVITLGYSAMFVAGFLAVLYILRGFFTSSLTTDGAKALVRMVYGVTCFATLFSFVGTVLGGIWADQSWGRFWGWDPKENGALLIVLWNAVYLHARWGRLASDQTQMAIAILGNVITAFSWFGVNMLGIGLHSYGFMDAAFKWLMLFMATQVALILLGLLPLRLWRSFAREEPSALPVNLKPAAAVGK
jgi:ABC-type transport system involved in cytochrome c biogenesis permease subunit